MVLTAASLTCGKGHALVHRATLTLSLFFLCFYSAGLAAPARNSQAVEQLKATGRHTASLYSGTNTSALPGHHPDTTRTLEQCHNVDYCPLAARCCRAGVDESGWIAAAVGWGLWFLTLILLCVTKLMTLSPDEPKSLPA
ncbi:PREDICTED: transmembrane protein 213 [Elephantulus edwardii]|uniref:transmembrane protein 213 n=1 Tax=Elephantulus edwardii TaxID=28737 RepID=UPI0003F0DCAF|nr:PREDICTED: transmembrane protein 213 [Elephantulus edwardii]